MSTKFGELRVSGLVVQVVHKDIKNLHLGVYPPNGRVRVAAPLAVDDEAVRLAVISKLGWIRKQQAAFGAQDRQSPREMVTGESHYFLGRRYRLRVVEQNGVGRVELRNVRTIDLYVRRGSDRAARERVLLAWYRAELRARVPALIAKWAAALGVEPPMWGIKQMKTKWGTCIAEAQRIWLNLELAKKPERCTEYIVMHELMHLLERRHNDRFVALMDRHLPHWRLLRDELNREPLGHSTWEY